MVLGSTMSGSLLPGYVAAAAADDAKKDAAKPQVSAAAGKDLQEAQKDMQAQKWDDMIVVLDKVKNNPKKNDYDEHVMNEFYVTAYANKKQLQEATGPLEFLIASKFTPPDELQKRVIQASFLYYQLQNYDKAIEYGNRAVKDGSATDQVHLVVAQSYYLKNDFKGTGTFVTGLVNDQIKAGTAPSNDLLQLGLSSAVKQNDDAGEAHWLELLVTYHPKPEYWQNLLDPLFRTKMPDRELLQLYRLSADVGNMKRGSDYAEMAQAALDAGSPGEAVTILNKAFADNAFADAAEQNGTSICWIRPRSRRRRMSRPWPRPRRMPRRRRAAISWSASASATSATGTTTRPSRISRRAWRRVQRRMQRTRGCCWPLPSSRPARRTRPSRPSAPSRVMPRCNG